MKRLILSFIALMILSACAGPLIVTTPPPYPPCEWVGPYYVCDGYYHNYHWHNSYPYYGGSSFYFRFGGPNHRRHRR